VPIPSLTPRQLAFVREYGKDANGTKAAIRAGYSQKGASVAATRLLRMPQTHAVLAPDVNIETGKETHKTLADIEKWKARVRRVAFANVSSENLTPDHVLKGLDMYGRHLGAFQTENPGLQQAFQININIKAEE